MKRKQQIQVHLPNKVFFRLPVLHENVFKKKPSKRVKNLQKNIADKIKRELTHQANYITVVRMYITALKAEEVRLRCYGDFCYRTLNKILHMPNLWAVFVPDLKLMNFRALKRVPDLDLRNQILRIHEYCIKELEITNRDFISQFHFESLQETSTQELSGEDHS